MLETNNPEHEEQFQLLLNHYGQLDDVEWKTRDGIGVKFKDMADSHLNNAIHYTERQIKQVEEHLAVITEEAVRITNNSSTRHAPVYDHSETITRLTDRINQYKFALYVLNQVKSFRLDFLPVVEKSPSLKLQNLRSRLSLSR